MAGGLFGGLIEEAILNRKKPKVPSAPNVSPQKSQRDSIAGNQAALPELEDLAGDVNEFNVGQRRKMLEGSVPGYERITTGASDVLSNWLSGQLSPDVASAVRRNANARAYAGGYAGGGAGSMKDFLEARDLGMTSLDLQKMGESAVPGYLGTMAQVATPRQFDPVGMFITPAEQIASEQWNENNRFSRDWLKNQIDAIPSGFQAALASTVGNLADPTSGALSLVGDVYGGSKGASPSYASSLAADYGGEMAAGGGASAGAASGGGY